MALVRLWHDCVELVYKRQLVPDGKNLAAILSTHPPIDSSTLDSEQTYATEY